MSRPTIHISNWSSHRTPGHHGPGTKWTIMALPKRPHEHGAGQVRMLCPNPDDVQSVRAGGLDMDTYRDIYRAGLSVVRHALAPGALLAYTSTGKPVLVRNGDTLCCVCKRSEAAAGRCHRVWAAEALAAAGWRVVLDGEELVVVSPGRETARDAFNRCYCNTVHKNEPLDE